MPVKKQRSAYGLICRKPKESLIWGMPRLNSFLFQSLIALIVGQVGAAHWPISYQTLLLLLIGALPLLLVKRYWVVKGLAFYGMLLLGAFTRIAYYSLPDYHYTLLGQEGLMEIEIEQSLKPNDFSYRYYGHVLRRDGRSSTGKILVTLQPKDSIAPLAIGDIILTKTPYRPIQKPKNPGEFDYATYLANLKIYGQIRLYPNTFLKHTPKIQPHSWTLWKQKRAAATAKIRSSTLTKAASAHWLALVFGERQYLEKDLRDAYANVGLIHLLAISGLHIGIIAALLGFLLRPMMRWNWGKQLRQLLLISFLWGFALMTGMSPAVVRAVSLFSLLFLGQWSQRPQPPLQRVFLSAWLLLVAHPPYLEQLGFQLSYLAVIGILSAMPLAQKIYHPKKKWKQWLWEAIVVCLAAQCAVGPLTLFYFKQFPTLFLLSNLLVLPLFTVSLLLAVIGTPIVILFGLPSVFLEGYSILIGGIHAVVEYIASLESFLWKGIYLPLWGVLICYALIVFGIRTILVKKWTWRVLIGTIILTFMGLFLSKLTAKKESPSLWILHQQGATLLIWYDNPSAQLYTDASQKQVDQLFHQFQRKYPVRSWTQDSLWRYLKWRQTELLVLDFETTWEKVHPQATIVLLKNNPKIHIERVLKDWYPKWVIADGSNSSWFIHRWQESCTAAGVSFHSTQSGACRISP